MVKPAPKKQKIEQDNREFALPEEIEIKEAPQTGLSVRSEFRDSMELQIAKQLDLNVDQLHQANLSDQRLKQIFDGVAADNKKLMIGVPVFIACAIATVASFAAMLMSDDPDVVIGSVLGIFGGMAGMAVTGAVIDSDLETKVKNEISNKLAEQKASPKLPSPENN